MYVQLTFNPIKVGGSEYMYSWVGIPAPRKNVLENRNRYRVEIHVHNPIVQGQLIKKKLEQ